MSPADETEREEQVAVCPQRARCLRGVCAAFLLGLPCLVGLAVLGCNETTRYRVLSFFFDGVPEPGKKAKRAGPVSRPSGPKQPGKDAEAVMASVHAPYTKRHCFKCHSTDASMRTDVFGAKLCRLCHEALFELEPTDWAHGPSAAGECSLCHKSHESKHLSLLTASEPGLCLRCHDAAVVDRPYHAGTQSQACSTCHDPHAAGNRLLLADARTYRRSRAAKRTARSQHAPWKERKCSACHLVEQANAIIKDINGVCRSCHKKALATTGRGKLHAPVRQGQCITCHLPHESFLPHLVRPSAEAICFQCHKPQETRSARHPRVDRVDCLLCHAGHSSDREHLLKPGIPVRPRPDPTPTPFRQSHGRKEARPGPSAPAGGNDR